MQESPSQWYAGGCSSNEEELSTPAPDEVIILDSATQPLSLEPVPWTDECDWTDELDLYDSDYHTSQSMGRYNNLASRRYPDSYAGVSSYSGGDNSKTVSLSSSTDAMASDINIPPSRHVSPTPPSFSIPPVPFSTPPKLKSVEQVMKENTGTDALSLRKLATALAREAIFGRKEMTTKSLSGRYATGELDRCKVDYIKTLVHSRVPKKSDIEFEAIWKQCRGSLSKSCQTLRNT